ncbi:VTT domain-containing protein [Paenibacillus sp. BR2-3]|uniref:TVP38/TMEM64 family protein n=1 Tax=Paenibacillus sp. BR2-3 TaxID=3048494 RepID=UPI0039775C69
MTLQILAIQSDYLAQWLSAWGTWAIIISIILNILISVIGIIPSVALTTVNIVVFGLVPGFMISWAGEVSGAMVSYILYRIGALKLNDRIRYSKKIEWMARIKSMSPKRQFIAVLLARLTPFIPSSLVTLISVLSEVSFSNYMLASVIGKLPSLSIEALIGYGYVSIIDGRLKLMISLLFLLLLLILIYSRQKDIK